MYYSAVYVRQRTTYQLRTEGTVHLCKVTGHHVQLWRLLTKPTFFTQVCKASICQCTRAEHFVQLSDQCTVPEPSVPLINRTAQESSWIVKII